MKAKLPEEFRVMGLNGDSMGSFYIPHNKIKGYYFFVIATDQMEWEHVSITLRQKTSRSKDKLVKRCCTWSEMCHLKEMFFKDTEAVMQLHPPKEDYVSTHPYCLHLWRPVINTPQIPLPPSILVGFKGDDVQSM